MQSLNFKGIMAHIYLRNQNAVHGLNDESLLGNGNVYELATYYEQQCVDALIIFDLSKRDSEHEAHLRMIKKLNQELKIPIIAGGHINNIDDIYALLQVGCKHVFLNMSKPSNLELLESASKTFGKDVMAICINEFNNIAQEKEYYCQYASFALLFGDDHHLYDAVRSLPLECIPLLETMNTRHIFVLMHDPNVMGISGEVISNKHVDLYALKERMIRDGINMHYREAALSWKDLKLNSDGLVPVIVQDYKNNQVLMMAYMNEEAYNKTVRSGLMTYWSRSRQSLWLKGETSGHYQHVKELFIDCDNDTILAKVDQEGAACHTGNRTCFYRSLLNDPHPKTDPINVFSTLYKNAKKQNTTFDRESIVHDTANIMYHLTTLMAKHEITWEDVSEHISDNQNFK